MHQKLIRLGVAATVVGVSAFAFQNCGKAGFDGENQGTLNLGSTSAQNSNAVPFAYNASFDQVSYMSCAAPALVGKQGYFTFLAGAYNTGGISMTTDFRNYVNSSNVLYSESGAPTPDQIKIYLSGTAVNAEAQPQFAIRAKSNVQQIRTPNSAQAVEGSNFVSMLGNLTDDRWLDPIVRYPSQFTNFFTLAPEGQRNLEGRIAYNTTEGIAKGMRDDLTSYSLLSLTFLDRASAGDITRARMPAGVSDSRIAYGKGYLVSFESAIAPYTTFIKGTGAMPNTFNPNNIMTKVTEVDLSNPTAPTTSTWTCDSNRRYMIVQPGADQTTYCPPDQFVNLLNTTYRQEYEIVRRTLKPEYWDVSITRRCAVPKEGSCYVTVEANGTAPMIEYDQTQPCYQQIDGIPYGNPIPVKRCAQYVSICTKN